MRDSICASSGAGRFEATEGYGAGADIILGDDVFLWVC